MIAPARPASTLVLLRPGPEGLEVLLTRRPASMAFGPRIHVFPGGRVESEDQDDAGWRARGLAPRSAAAALGGDLEPSMAIGYHVAAIRETFEEVGIEVAVPQLVPMTRWVTPINLERRFDVRFFGAIVPPGTDVGPLAGEVDAVAWLTPRAALVSAARGEIELWQPTFVTLQQLLGVADEAGLRAAFAPGPGSLRAEIQPGRGGSIGPAAVEMPWAGGIPGRVTRGWLAGDRELLLVNAADPTTTTLDAVLAFVATRGARLAGVVIPGLEPERHAGVEMFATGLNLPVVAPRGRAAGAPYAVIEADHDARPPVGDADLSLEELLAG